MKTEKLGLAAVEAVAVGALFYVLGSVANAVVPGITALTLGAVGFAVGLTHALIEK